MFVIKQALLILIRIIDVLILARILLSFLPQMRTNKIIDFIYQMTEPILGPCQTLLEKVGLNNGMIDFSPILAYLLLRVATMIVYIL